MLKVMIITKKMMKMMEMKEMKEVRVMVKMMKIILRPRFCRLQMYHSSKHVKRCATKMCSCIQTYCL